MESFSGSSLLLKQEELKDISPKTAFNINIGVLGHVDTGKTSLAKTLSVITSTASLDKNPQSKERGITLDLGFSAFFLKLPQTEKFKNYSQYKYIQFTLVDCPGHASLIKTIIGGAQIIDIMFLVIDINKGIQTQTAECLVIGELLMQKMIVVLNKIDLIPKEEREETIKKKIEALRKVFSKTKFGQNVPIIPISAMVNADETIKQSINIDLLLQTLLNEVSLPQRNSDGPFYFLIDHCFLIKGQGSVVTGTVIQGKVSIGDDIQFPQINDVKKVKSIQMFKKNIDQGIQGDRIGMLFTQLDHNLIERGIACSAGIVENISLAIVPVNKISYFKFPIKSKSKFHITSGHQNVMAQITLFSQVLQGDDLKFIEEFQKANNNFIKKKFQNQFNYSHEYEFVDNFEDYQLKKYTNRQLYALLQFEKPLLGSMGSLVIGSKFDTDLESNVCRIGFYGLIIGIMNDKELKEEKKLKIYKEKQRTGIIEKVIDNYGAIVKDMFKKETNINLFLNRPIKLELTQNEGKIHSSFGKSGKVKVVTNQEITKNFKKVQQTQQTKEQKVEKLEGSQLKSKEVEEQKAQTEEAKDNNSSLSSSNDVVKVEELINTKIIMPYKKYMFSK